MNTCPCCSEILLRHVRHNKIYWFCTHCWQEMDDPLWVRAEIEQSDFERSRALLPSGLLSLAALKSLATLQR